MQSRILSRPGGNKLWSSSYLCSLRIPTEFVFVSRKDGNFQSDFLTIKTFIKRSQGQREQQAEKSAFVADSWGSCLALCGSFCRISPQMWHSWLKLRNHQLQDKQLNQRLPTRRSQPTLVFHALQQQPLQPVCSRLLMKCYHDSQLPRHYGWPLPKEATHFAVRDK